jgi:hypothetical protein
LRLDFVTVTERSEPVAGPLPRTHQPLAGHVMHVRVTRIATPVAFALLSDVTPTTTVEPGPVTVVSVVSTCTPATVALESLATPTVPTADATDAEPANVVTPTRLRLTSTRLPSTDGVVDVRNALAMPAPATAARLDEPHEMDVTVTVAVCSATRAPVIAAPAPAIPTPPIIDVTTPDPATDATVTVLYAAVTVEAVRGLPYAATPTPPTEARICADEVIAAVLHTELKKLTDRGAATPGLVIEAMPTQPTLTRVATVDTALVIIRELVTLTDAARMAELVAAAMPMPPATAAFG